MSKHLVGFRADKAAQVSAFFAWKSGGDIDKLKLSKLLYLTERDSMSERGRPMFFDEFYSLKDGPIASEALNGINGLRSEGVWTEYVIRKDNDTISAAKSEDLDILDSLSKSDLRILNLLWEKHGWMDSWKIRGWTHDEKNCPEYTEVSGSAALPISYRDVFEALGFENPASMAQVIANHRSLEALSSK